jgi:hypothetical protein
VNVSHGHLNIRVTKDRGKGRQVHVRRSSPSRKRMTKIV